MEINEQIKNIHKYAMEEFIKNSDKKSIFNIGETVLVYKKTSLKGMDGPHSIGEWAPAIVYEIVDVYANGNEIIKVLPKLKNGSVGAARRKFYYYDDPKGLKQGVFMSTVIKI